MTAPLPRGFRVVLDPDTQRLDATTWYGGQPARALRLTGPGLAAWAELQEQPVFSANAGTLARRLTDAGLAHPRPVPSPEPLDLTVVIPVRDRAAMLARCLRGLGNAHPVLVVDDGSTDPDTVAKVVADHGARLLRRPTNGGPGTARNAGLAEVHSDFVAFIDSDCAPSHDWAERLAAHLQDPLVAAVAPRIVALPSSTSAGRYGAARGSLDLGEREARVVPGTRVGYVPTAALLLRRSALADVGTFDPALRYGEDVDLVWRLHEAGWRIRYDPSVQVAHQEPERWIPLLHRRFHYGTSAAALAARHPDQLAPLVLQPLPTLAAAAVVVGRPVAAIAVLGATWGTLRHAVRRAGLPTDRSLSSAVTTAQQTWLGIGRYTSQFAAPVVAAAMVAPGGRRPWARRAALTALILSEPTRRWLEARPAIDPVRFLVGHVADDIAYGAGVYAGCLRGRDATALRPRIVWRPIRRNPDPKDPH